MSGEKCGSVSVDDDVFEEARRQLEIKEMEELRRLEKEEHLEEKERRRLEDLRRREQARKERESERLRREQERAEQVRRREMEALDRILSQLNASRAVRGDLEERFPGLVLPPFPDPPSADLANIDSIRATAAETARLARQYQRDVDGALVRYHQAKTIARAPEQAQSWALQFRKRAVRTASDVVAALEPSALFAADGSRRAQLKTMAERARILVRQFVGTAEDDLTEDTLDALDAVLSSDDAGSAQLALERLRIQLQVEEERRKEKERDEQQRSESQLIEQRREQTRDIAAAIGNALEDLGYSVSGAKETAFVRNGHLYAIHGEWPDHALRLEFDPGSDRIRSVPLRVVGENAPVYGSADIETMGKEDIAFDAHWCEGQDGIVSLRDLAAKRGINLTFSRIHRPGEVAVETVSERELDKKMCLTRREAMQNARLKKSRALTARR